MTIEGIDFVELAGPEPDRLHRLLTAFGFSRTMRHARRGLDLYRQGDITFLLLFRSIERDQERRGVI